MNCGPLGGIYTGLVHSKSDKVFFIACDMPFLNIEYIQYISEQFYDNDTHTALVTRFGEWIEPFCSFYTKGLAEDIANYLERGHRKIQPFLSEKEVCYIDEEMAREFSYNWKMFSNINTVTELNENFELLDTFTKY